MATREKEPVATATVPTRDKGGWAIMSAIRVERNQSHQKAEHIMKPPTSIICSGCDTQKRNHHTWEPTGTPRTWVSHYRMRWLKPAWNTNQCRVSDNMGPNANAKGEIQQNKRCRRGREPAAGARSLEPKQDDKQGGDMAQQQTCWSTILTIAWAGSWNKATHHTQWVPSGKDHERKERPQESWWANNKLGSKKSKGYHESQVAHCLSISWVYKLMEEEGGSCTRDGASQAHRESWLGWNERNRVGALIMT